MLGVLLRSFDDLAVLSAAEAGNEQSRRRLAAQMHKLRGSAGMLGARKLQRLAADAESALWGETCASDLAVILLDLTDACTALATHARPFLDVQAQVESARLDAAERMPLQRADLAKLHRLLLKQDLAALDYFRSLSAPLRSVLPKVSFDRLCRAMDDLDLVLAASLLKDIEAGADESASPSVHQAAAPDAANA
jgi:HPt (histidine-containing phosphotransfer) domain-containing protein